MTELNFNKVETGDFEFHSFAEKQTFIGFFIGIEKDEGSSRVHNKESFDIVNLGGKGLQGILFKDYETGKYTAISTYHVLTQTFEQLDCDFDKTVFKITFLGKKKAGNGEVNLFDIQKATI